MSDEKRREELKAKINEQLDKLSIEDLESVAGGLIRNAYQCDAINDKGLQCLCCFGTEEALAEHKRIGNHQFSEVVISF